jgi:hypothetical protein
MTNIHIPESIRVERNRFETERAIAERAYEAAQTIVDTIGTSRWIRPGEFIDLVKDLGNVSTYYAQMALSDFRSQGIVENVPGLGVRSLNISDDFEDAEPLRVISASISPTSHYGTAHWEY